MATLTTQSITRAGITPTFAAVTGGGDACEVSVDLFLEFKNTNAATYTATLAIPSTVSTFANVTYTSVAVTIPATTGDKMIGPITPDLFKDTTTGFCQITYTGTTTNGTVGAFKVQGP
jgi:type IV secretory pathway VirB6-like protein